MVFDLNYFYGLLFSTEFLRPALTTVGVTCASMTIAAVIGTGLGIGLLSRSVVVAALCRTYTWFFRAIPSVVQIVFWYNGLSAMTNNVVNLPAIVAGIIALSIYESAYMAEITRSALMSIDVGQREAALSLGMTHRKSTWRIVIPQAVRIAIPPTGNEFIKMLKGTSLLFTIAVPELFARATQIYSGNFRYFEVLAVVSIWYLALTSAFTLLQRPLEKYFSRFGSKR